MKNKRTTQHLKYNTINSKYDLSLSTLGCIAHAYNNYARLNRRDNYNTASIENTHVNRKSSIYNKKLKNIFYHELFINNRNPELNICSNFTAGIKDVVRILGE